MRRSGRLAVEALSDLKHHRRALLIFHLFFALLATAILIPAISWTLTVLLSRTGRPMVSNEELFAFALSPAGVGWGLAAGTLAVLLVYLEQAGITVIAASGTRRPYRAAVAALWAVARRLPRLLQVAAVQVAAHGLVSAPFALAVVVAYVTLLGDFDPYYLVREQPPVIRPFLAVAGPLLLLLLACNAWLYLRWALALPAVALEGLPARRALSRSAGLTRGWKRSVAALVLVAATLVVLLPVAVAALFDGAAGTILGWLPERVDVLIPATVAVLAAFILLSVALTFLGIAGNSLLVHVLYQHARGGHVAVREKPPKRSGLLAWGGELALLAFAFGQAAYVLLGFSFQDDVANIAHRGSSMKAPENTISAIEQAIADGADYVEIDVRATADGTPVLLHDRDLRRVAGIDRAIWEMTDAELEEVEVGSWFDPAFGGESIPTLAEAVAAVGDNARLYIEVKPSPATPELTQNVLEHLRAGDALDGTFIAALDPRILWEVTDRAPEARRAFLVHTRIGRLPRARFEALAARAGITGRDAVAAAQRQGHDLHVWTVNDSAEMARFIDLGVDGIITDRPDVLAALLEERAALSDAELLVVKLRNWLRN